MNKRIFLIAGTATIATAWLYNNLPQTQKAIAASNKDFEIKKTEEQWRKLLTPWQFCVLRQRGTERSHSSPLDKQYDKGIYNCAGCDLPVFSSETKFDSGTGWPSFYAPITGAVETSIDKSLLATRIEVHCRRCGGHLGHVFDDGPKPTGKRYCMNGVALKFIAGG
ncbi:peptide-methionine (R)-S-oxide reductase MsrB [Candidatus Gracilibacteria bacterium]|nr:peptide-methionine (R)-S-oxide reductase MsrB [Candidatus Gracilibacteria bacterium]NJP20324.1 peptide-methionine (R)-S-oxide reductase MsrB [Hydrococcus sp. CRU_1_1]